LARHHLDPQFILCNGDSWFAGDRSQFLSQAESDPSDVVGRMLLRDVDAADRYGTADMAGDVITGFRSAGSGLG
jgi:dTDP-glucose pyrophosphorylase